MTQPHYTSDDSFLAPYACKPLRGRMFETPPATTRSEFQRDRDRIIHSGAFRRLQYKTQVFVAHEGDNYRTRLTHSIEVAQIARSIAISLGLDQHLAEAIALAHDLGHTPFGHAGEDALTEALASKGYPEFNHNDQTLRIVSQLEARYAAFDGLNLTWETVEGIAKHNGPVFGQLPETIKTLDDQWGLDVTGYASGEAQVAALADDIAYNCHDIDDGVRVGLISFDDFTHLPLLGDMIRDVTGRHPNLDSSRLRHEVLRLLMDAMVSDVVATASARLRALPEASCHAIRQADGPMVEFSLEMQSFIKLLRKFLYENIYRHYRVNRTRVKARKIVKDLFFYYLEHPECFPDPLRAKVEAADEPGRIRFIIDHIAGLTDPAIIAEHKALFNMHSHGALQA